MTVLQGPRTSGTYETEGLKRSLGEKGFSWVSVFQCNPLPGRQVDNLRE